MLWGKGTGSKEPLIALTNPLHRELARHGLRAGVGEVWSQPQSPKCLHLRGSKVSRTHGSHCSTAYSTDEHNGC